MYVCTEKEVQNMAKKKIEEVKIAVPAEGYFGRSLSNIVFTLYSRQLLLSKAAGKEAVHIEESYAKALKESKPAETGDFINVQKEAGNGSRGFEVTEKELVFTFPTSDDIPPACWAELASAICDHARSHRNVIPRLCEAENEKYAMRIWLMQIGFTGEEGAMTRTAFLRNLTGNCAFKTDGQLKAAAKKRRKLV
jgi:hypothetical protein